MTKYEEEEMKKITKDLNIDGRWTLEEMDELAEYYNSQWRLTAMKYERMEEEWR